MEIETKSLSNEQKVEYFKDAFYTNRFDDANKYVSDIVEYKLLSDEELSFLTIKSQMQNNMDCLVFLTKNKMNVVMKSDYISVYGMSVFLSQSIRNLYRTLHKMDNYVICKYIICLNGDFESYKILEDLENAENTQSKEKWTLYSELAAVILSGNIKFVEYVMNKKNKNGFYELTLLFEYTKISDEVCNFICSKLNDIEKNNLNFIINNIVDCKIENDNENLHDLCVLGNFDRAKNIYENLSIERSIEFNNVIFKVLADINKCKTYNLCMRNLLFNDNNSDYYAIVKLKNYIDIVGWLTTI
jgi:hypothetical protein